MNEGGGDNGLHKTKKKFWYPPLKVKRKLLIWINGLKHSCN